MKIGLISDTHIPSMGTEPPPEVRVAFAGVDAIIHAGDVYIQSCIDWLEQIAPVYAAPTGFRAGASEASPRTSAPLVVELEGHKIGVVHKLSMMPLTEEVYPGAIEKWYPKHMSIRAELQDIFEQPVDIVVFGYTHEAMIETHEGVLFVNSGSPNMVKQVMRVGTVAILDLTPTSAEARIIDLKTITA